MRNFIQGGRLRGLAAATALLLLGSVAGCNASEKLLESVDPDLLTPESVKSAEGALALYQGALGRFRQSTAGSGGEGSSWLFGGLLADEWSTSSTFVQNDEGDQRAIPASNSTTTGMYRDLTRTRTSSTQAIKSMVQYRPTELSRIAELYFARGISEMQLASDYCNGVVLSDGSDAPDIVFGRPQPVSAIFTIAIASFDSALTFSTATDAFTVSVNRAARIGKARALLGLGQYAAAGAAIGGTAGVPSNYTYNMTFLPATGDVTLWAQPFSSRRYSVGDSLEGNARNLLVRNAIPFFSARDPRVPVNYTVSANGRDTTRSQDGMTFSRTTPLWGRSTPVPVVSGLDARLIDAEVALNSATPAAMIPILNALRATPQILGTVTTPVMTPLVDPGTTAGRVDLLFREKAFWQFGRGHRLGDLRRLVRQYGRAVNATFPEGAHFRGGTYGAGTSLPVPQQEQNNPEVGTGTNTCLDQNP